jgi:hypothetical protein
MEMRNVVIRIAEKVWVMTMMGKMTRKTGLVVVVVVMMVVRLVAMRMRLRRISVLGDGNRVVLVLVDLMRRVVPFGASDYLERQE